MPRRIYWEDGEESLPTVSKLPAIYEIRKEAMNLFLTRICINAMIINVLILLNRRKQWIQTMKKY